METLSLVEQIRKRMEDKSTEELLEIWQKHDTDEWSSEAFDAIQQVLSARGEKLPQQGQLPINQNIDLEDVNFLTCEKCKMMAKGNHYTFYYGKTSGKKTENTGNGMRVIQLYSNIRSESVYLCDNCVRTASRINNTGSSIVFFFLTFITSLFLGGMIFEKINGDDQVPTILLIVLGIFSLAFLLGSIDSIHKRKTGHIDQNTGEQMAILSRMADLKTLGYDSFWNTEGYKSLSIDISTKF